MPIEKECLKCMQYDICKGVTEYDGVKCESFELNPEASIKKEEKKQKREKDKNPKGGSSSGIDLDDKETSRKIVVGLIVTLFVLLTIGGIVSYNMLKPEGENTVTPSRKVDRARFLKEAEAYLKKDLKDMEVNSIEKLLEDCNILLNETPETELKDIKRKLEKRKNEKTCLDMINQQKN